MTQRAMWAALLMLLAGGAGHCEAMLRLLNSLHEHWRVGPLTIVYDASGGVAGCDVISVPTPEELSPLNMHVSLVRLSQFSLQNTLGTSVLLALPAEKIRHFLQQEFQAGSTALPEQASLLLPVAGESEALQLTEGLYLPLDRQVFALAIPSRELLELYHVAPFRPINPERAATVAQVPWGTVIPLPEAVLWGRRTDLQGTVFRAGTKEDPPEVIIHSWRPFQVSGYFPEVWRELETALNFTTEYQTAHSSSFGQINGRGVWTGLVGKLQRGEIELAVAGMTMSCERKDVVDFTGVVYRSSYQVYFHLDTELFSLASLSFISPWTILASLCATVAVTSGAQLLIARLGPEGKDDWEPTMAVVFYNLCAFCQQGASWERLPRCTPGRLTLWLTYCAGMLVFSMFSATLMSRLAVCFKTVPFTSLTELVATGSYTLGGRRGTADGDILQSGVLERSQWLDESCFPTSNLAGLERACRERFAFITPYNRHYTNHAPQALPCQLHQVALRSLNDNLSIAVSKGLPHRRLLDFYLRKMRESGLLNRLRSKWYATPPPPAKPPTTIKMHHIAPLLGWILLSVLVSTCVLIMERCLHSRKKGATQPHKKWLAPNTNLHVSP